MNFQILGQALASLSYAGRNPSWLEYAEGSPAEQRAIIARWLEIQKAGLSDDWAAAVGRYGRALSMQRAKPVETEMESAQSQWSRGEQPGPDTAEDQGL